jgi:hypothetical protein
MAEKQKLCARGGINSLHKFLITWKLEKFKAMNSREILEKNIQPYEVIETPPDLLLNEGITMMLYHLCAIGSSGLKWDNTNARIGIGNDATAPSVTDTDLIGASKTYKAQNASYPQASGTDKVLFQSDFINGEAEYAWNEEVVDNGAVDGDTLCRNNTSLGTKPAGQTWRVTCTITLS